MRGCYTAKNTTQPFYLANQLISLVISSSTVLEKALALGKSLKYLITVVLEAWVLSSDSDNRLCTSCNRIIAYSACDLHIVH